MSSIPAKDAELVALGRVARAHGIAGELRIHLYNPDSTVLLEQKQVVLRQLSKQQVFAVHKARVVPKALLLSFKGMQSRNEAEPWQGAEVCVPSAVLPELDEAEYYIRDLIGLAVHDASQGLVGKVIDVLSYPSVDCLSVQSDDGLREVPLIDDFVLQVDTQKGLVLVQRWDEFEVQPVSSGKVK